MPNRIDTLTIHVFRLGKLRASAFTTGDDLDRARKIIQSYDHLSFDSFRQIIQSQYGENSQLTKLLEIANEGAKAS